MAVLPRWRGFSLSRALNQQALSALRETDIRHLFATSSPRNPYGLRQLMAVGFRSVRLGVKFGGKMRVLSYRPFPEDMAPAAADLGERSIPLTATTNLDVAFRTGWVGVGVETSGTDSLMRLRYQPAPFDC